MKSERSKQFIDNDAIVMRNGDRMVDASTAYMAIELAEQEAEERMRDELTRWRDPKEELPEIGKDVLFRIKYPLTNIFSYQVGQLQDNGRIRLPRIELGDIVGWRKIHE